MLMMKESTLCWLGWLLLGSAFIGPVPVAGSLDDPFWMPSTDRLEGDRDGTVYPTHPKDVYQYLDGVYAINKPCTDKKECSDGSKSFHSTTKTFGYSDIPNKIPMSQDSHFPIASNSKLYTAVAIYQLHEQGKLDVDTDIATMLDKKDFENFGWTNGHQRKKLCPQVGGRRLYKKCEVITLRNLLSMSSGIYPPLNCDAPEPVPGECNPDPYFFSRGSIGKTVGTFLDQPLMFAPGSDYHYSNPNFILAAYFVEKYSGMTFRAYLKKNIFDRMGFNETHYDFFNEALQLDPKRVRQYCRYYDSDTDELISVGYDNLQLDLGISSGTGGIISTAQEEATFWYTLFDKDKQGAPLISPESREAILSPWNLVQQFDFHYPNGTILPAWVYYMQGMGMVCDTKDCVPHENDDAAGSSDSSSSDSSSIRWLSYEGGAITVMTANILDFQSMKMAQVWTSTLVAKVSLDDFQKGMDLQSGFPLEVVNPWLDPTLNNPMALAWAALLQNNDEENGNFAATV